MRSQRQMLLLALLFSSLLGWSQTTKIVIPAGTPEDKELATITAESDGQKRIALYEDFLKKYADNKPAAAYADWQLSQQYLAAGDTAKALEYGNKAVELYPNDLDILVSQVSVAQATKDNGKIVQYAAQGGKVYNGIASQTKPADASDADWTAKVADEQESARSNYEFLESAAYNAIVAEQDAGKRMTYIEEFTPSFPKSKFEQPVSQLALYSLQQLNQPERLESYGEKALAADPDSIPTLLMLANAYAENPAQAGKAVTYANKVISVTSAKGASEDKNQKLAEGVAHSTLGYAYLQEGKLTLAVPELKTAVTMLQNDPQAEQAALFRLGYAYAKQNHRADSVVVLQKAAAIDGPYQNQAKQMLAKVSATGK